MHLHNRPAFALLALAATAAFAPLPALAEDTRPREATIIVSGEGEATLAPDMAVLSLGVVSQAPAAADALSANNAAMAKVLTDLKADGLAERDLQTSNFAVMPQYRPIPDGDTGEKLPDIVGYTVQNTLTVRLRDLSKLGALIDRSVKLGVNQGGDIAFTNDEPEAAIAEARKEAVADALAKARTLTEAAGVRLGRIIEISENYSRPMPQTLYRAAMSKEMADAAPVASGENSYSVTVNVTFAIEQ
ncbi:SIMPL domain-containing protein [Rhizobium sp. CG5]|uniref:SIMPL domain-containing protein n=1 Tax=Rhizobium sp. CG5 TaxID=2726076 RepID=UPI0020341973|nr:SIMPL domain-containing protein [Rhizobium sp. CG5]MCM2471903.1 SIMPL domain-containing protein [Rhizobium sp. CG5]